MLCYVNVITIVTKVILIYYSCADYPCSKSNQGLKLPQRIDSKQTFTITYSYSVEFVVSYMCVCVLALAWVMLLRLLGHVAKAIAQCKNHLKTVHH